MLTKNDLHDTCVQSIGPLFVLHFIAFRDQVTVLPFLQGTLPLPFCSAMSVTSSVYNQQYAGGPTLQQPTIHEYLNELVSKRVTTLKYLRKAHEGNTHWFNTILLSKSDLANLYPNSRMQRRQDEYMESMHSHRLQLCEIGPATSTLWVSR